MKIRSLLFCAWLSLSITASLLVGGCTSAGSGTGGQWTLKQTRLDIDGRMTRYRNAVASGAAVTLGERQRVDEAYKNYQTAFDAAVQAAHNNYDTPAPDNVKAAANQLIQTLSSITF
jgi:hypothetical protein